MNTDEDYVLVVFVYNLLLQIIRRLLFCEWKSWLKNFDDTEISIELETEVWDSNSNHISTNTLQE